MRVHSRSHCPRSRSVRILLMTEVRSRISLRQFSADLLCQQCSESLLCQQTEQSSATKKDDWLFCAGWRVLCCTSHRIYFCS